MKMRRATSTGTLPAATVARDKRIREKYQREKPSLEQVLASNPNARVTTLGELLQLHELAAQLKAERLNQQLTLAELASRTGIDQATLSRFESGKSENPTFNTILRVASSLGKIIRVKLEDDPALVS